MDPIASPAPSPPEETEKQRAARVLAEVDQTILASGLNHRQIKFAMRFVETRDIVRAAEYAGYAKSVANTFAPRWLDETTPDYNPKLAAMIRLKTQAVAEAEALTVHDLIAQLKATVFTDPLDFFDTSGDDEKSQLRDISKIPLHARMAIQEIEQTALADGKVLKTKFKIRDKDASIDKLMRWLGGYERDNLQKAESYVVLAAPLSPDQAKVINATPVADQGDPIAVARSMNTEDMSRSNNWVVENDLDDPLVIKK
jgi:phage terminase small subunit